MIDVIKKIHIGEVFNGLTVVAEVTVESIQNECILLGYAGEQGRMVVNATEIDELVAALQELRKYVEPKRTAIKVGDQFRVLNYDGTGITKDRIITVTRLHADWGDEKKTYSVRCDQGCPLLIDAVWLERGLLERV